MRVLIIDDDADIRKTAALALANSGWEAVGVANGASAREQIDAGPFEAALVDLKLGDENGLDLIPELLRRSPALRVVVCTAFASMDTATEAMRLGAVDYVAKPFTSEQIREVLGRTLRTRRLESRLAELESTLRANTPDADLTTNEPVVQQAYDILFKVAATPTTILLLGENGTGKSVLARAIHDRSPRSENSFVTVSCPGLSRELLESELFGHVRGALGGATADRWGKVTQADAGTLFLDEISETPLEIQARLLRLLEEREYERPGEVKPHTAHIRLITASSRDLEAAVRDGTFRADLYHRINVITVRLPPLRERPADLLHLAEGYRRFFAAQCSKRVGHFSRAAEEALLAYRWPGNLRELRNVVERAVILGQENEIAPGDLPETLRPNSATTTPAELQLGGRCSLAELETEHIRRILRRSHSLDEAARTLAINPATLYRKRKRFGLGD